MEVFPNLQAGLFNGWLLLLHLYAIFGVMMLSFPKNVVARLYERPAEQRRLGFRRIFALIFFGVLLALMIMTPLKLGSFVFYFGFFLFLLGLVGFVAALLNYRDAPMDAPITQGLYRISRHPQQVTLYLGFLGICIAMGSWLAVAMMIIGMIGGHYKVRAEEEACLAQYGESYRRYMEQIPRYFLFF